MSSRSLLLTLCLALVVPTLGLAQPCFDVTGNDTVDGADTLFMTAFQGITCDPASADPLEVAACDYDLNGNGVVGCVDLHIVLANQGPCPCLGDVDGDDDVDFDDRDLVLAATGTDCSADLDYNRSVNSDDGIEVLLECLLYPGPAYVYEPDPRADLNGDGSVSLADAATLFTLIAGGPIDCAANLVADDEVNALDLLIVDHRINAGGTCP